MYRDQFESLNRGRLNWQTEEEVRLGWLTELQNKLAITFHAERGRSDADYNQVIIEFKNVGLFHHSETSPKFLEALEELSRYISAKAQEDNIDIQNYQGIAIDGESIAFVYMSQSGGVFHGPIMPLSPASVQMVFEACHNSSRRSLTASNLIEDFGHGSITGGRLMQALSNALMSYLDARENNKVKMLYMEWKALYGQVADLSSFQVDSILRSIGFTCVCNAPDKLSRILFVIHELYAIVPNRGITPAYFAETQNVMVQENPRLFEYFHHFERQLRNRSTYKTRMPTAPYYAIYNVGGYTFAPWKVVWPEQPGNSGLPVAVVNTRTLRGIGERLVIPDHKIYFAGFDEASKAFYLCGLLLCSTVQRFILSFHIMLQVGDIFKHMKLPEYDPTNGQHFLLAKLVKEAHTTTDKINRQTLLEQISNIGNSIIENCLIYKPTIFSPVSAPALPPSATYFQACYSGSAS